ncbi:MAG: GerAB/ArcD/ProY family transporter [Caulobacteraceae bacterium]
MIKEGKFGTHEAVCLVTIIITAKMFFTSPGILADILGTATWYMTLLSAATAAVGFTFIYLLLKRFPGKNIVEAFEASLGRFCGFIFSFLLVLLFMLNASAIVREFVEVLKVYVLPLTPISFLIGIFVAVVTVVSFLGLEAIARYAKLSSYILLASFITVLILASQKYETFRMFPIFGHGLAKTIQHGLARSSFYGEVLILAVVADSLQGTKYIKKAGYLSLVLSGILVSSALLAFTLTFPYYTGAEITAPMYQLTAMIDYGRFLQRLEPIFLFIWFVSSFLSVTAIFYTSASLYCKIFRIQDMRPIIFPFAIIFFTVAMIPSDITTVATGYIHRSREYGWTILYIPPLIALIMAIVRKKEVEKQNA